MTTLSLMVARNSPPRQAGSCCNLSPWSCIASHRPPTREWQMPTCQSGLPSSWPLVFTHTAAQGRPPRIRKPPNPSAQPSRPSCTACTPGTAKGTDFSTTKRAKTPQWASYVLVPRPSLRLHQLFALSNISDANLLGLRIRSSTQ
jgi:hypothetical protein